jgi:uncharacterized protein with NRDE domain
LQKVESEAENYTGFNLLIADFFNDELAYFSNRSNGVKSLDEGIYGLSNALLDTSWQKVIRGKNNLKETLANDNISADSLLKILQDRTFADDADLPETGVGIEYERILSPCFIETPIYGTRSSSVILVGNDNSIEFVEKSYQPDLPVFSTKFLFNPKPAKFGQ